MPAARQLSRSTFLALAVKAMTGRCPPAARSRSRIASHDLEAVELRHVEVQEQEVEGKFTHQVQCLPAVTGQPHVVAPPSQQPLQVPHVELAVLGHQNAQGWHAGGRRRLARSRPMAGRRPAPRGATAARTAR